MRGNEAKNHRTHDCEFIAHRFRYALAAMDVELKTFAWEVGQNDGEGLGPHTQAHVEVLRNEVHRRIFGHRNNVFPQ